MKFKIYNSFEEVSHDVNPIHVSQEYAINTQFKNKIYHGVNLLICSLDRILKYYGSEKKIVKLKALFKAHVITSNEKILNIELIKVNGSCIHFVTREGAKDIIDCEIYLEEKAEDYYLSKDTSFAPDTSIIDNNHTMLISLMGVIQETIYEPCFDKLTKYLNNIHNNKKLVTELSFISYLIGMKIPGLHSILASIAWQDTNIRVNNIYKYYLKKFRSASNYGEICLLTNVESNIYAKIGFLVRPKVEYREYSNSLVENIQTKYASIAFKKILVIGSSKGIGLEIFSILAHNNNNIIGTYRTISEELSTRLPTLNAVNPSATLLRLQVPEDLNQLPLDDIDVVFYLATPQIISDDSMISYGKLKVFLDSYCDCVHKIVSSMNSSCSSADARKQRKIIVIPSSTAIEKSPKNMREYAMAKSLSEQYYKELNNDYPFIEFIAPRLSRTSTVQTLSVLDKSISAYESAAKLLDSVVDYYRK